jgi:hypothetical protein
VTPLHLTNPPTDTTEHTPAAPDRPGPCCGPLAAEYVGTTAAPAGPRTLWQCRACGGGWTEPTGDPHLEA